MTPTSLILSLVVFIVLVALSLLLHHHHCITTLLFVTAQTKTSVTGRIIHAANTKSPGPLGRSEINLLVLNKLDRH